MIYSETIYIDKKVQVSIDFNDEERSCSMRVLVEPDKETAEKIVESLTSALDDGYPGPIPIGINSDRFALQYIDALIQKFCVIRNKLHKK